LAVSLVIAGLDPARYECSELHASGRTWPEKNCYVDIWIELLHAWGFEPRAMLPFVMAVDFVGDQWTFFKPPHGELHELYGIDVQELTVWRPLLEHAVEHLADGRLICMEVDSFWLPDTAGTDYRRNHVKTTIAMNAIDPETRRLGYFHGTGYHQLEGEDFGGIFNPETAADALPLFAEYVRMGNGSGDRCPPRELAMCSRALLMRHLARAPRENPLSRFAERFECELASLQQRGLAHYHQWAFAGLRQLGAAMELAAIHLRWLEAARVLRAGDAAEAFDFISGACKSLVLKGARAVNSGRPMDVATPCLAMAAAWERGIGQLRATLRSGVGDAVVAEVW
jgi:hypothetical protein